MTTDVQERIQRKDFGEKLDTANALRNILLGTIMDGGWRTENGGWRIEDRG